MMMVEAKRVDESKNFWRVRFRDPSQFAEFRNVSEGWAKPLLESIAPGSEIVMGKTEAGNWFVQAVLIPKALYTEDGAREVAEAIQDEVERDKKYESRDPHKRDYRYVNGMGYEMREDIHEYILYDEELGAFRGATAWMTRDEAVRKNAGLRHQNEPMSWVLKSETKKSAPMAGTSGLQGIFYATIEYTIGGRPRKWEGVVTGDWFGEAQITSRDAFLDRVLAEYRDKGTVPKNFSIDPKYYDKDGKYYPHVEQITQDHFHQIKYRLRDEGTYVDWIALREEGIEELF
jgi:hypothetical protein